MKFNSGKEMHDYICNVGDLYNINTGIYVCEYNDAHAVCVYHLRPDEVIELIAKSKESGEYWEAYLGAGGKILDAEDYNNDVYRYSEDETMRNLYLKPTLDFCEHMYKEEWVDTIDLTVEEVQRMKRKLDIAKMLTISTSHLSEQTFSMLAVYDFTPIVSYNYEFGTFIHIPDNLDSYDSTMPRELIKCIEFAKENDCEWLRFDRDGDIIDELQTFEW